MFTGFASENTPAIKVWDFSQNFASAFVTRSVALTDDCAPIQFFKTGGGSANINVYLPSAPIEGKTVRILNAKYGNSNHKIIIYASDTRGLGASAIAYVVGVGQQITLVYTLSSISSPFFGTNASTGWISLEQGPASSNNPVSVCFGYDNQAPGLYSGVLGGNQNTASGENSVVVGGAGHTASSNFTACVGGSSNAAQTSGAVAIGGQFNNVTGTLAVAVGGTSASVSGQYAVVVGGISNTANALNSIISGGSSGTTRSIVGNFVTPASDAPITSIAGRHQLATLLLGRQTTDATATRLASDSNAAATTNQVILPNNSAYAFQGTCIANVTGAGDTSSWKFEGAIKRGANAASTTLVAAVIPTVIAQDAGASTWVLAITADTTRGGIAVTVTGAAATTIRWVAKIETTEVTF
jgi:hypothetical protein